MKTFDAVKKKLDPNRRCGCFELFGYDFMVDTNLNVWLIEVNSSPSMELSTVNSILLKYYLLQI